MSGLNSVGGAAKMIELVLRAQHTVAFLRTAAMELRRMSEDAPQIAGELRHVARQLETDADDLAREETE